MEMKNTGADKSRRTIQGASGRHVGFRPRLSAGLTIVLVTVMVYLPSLSGGFLWDDRDNITGNPTKRSLAGLVRTWTDPYANQQYYPLTHTVFWLEWQVWGNSPAGYRAVNVCLHALNALLLYLILRRLSFGGALLGAILFAVHPIQVESVCWITELKNLLSGALFLSAGLMYLLWIAGRGTDDERHGSERRRPWLYAVSLTLFALAVLAKTTACLLPAGLGVIVWWKGATRLKREALPLAPFFALGLSGAVLISYLEIRHAGAQGAEFSWGVAERFIMAGKSFWYYLLQLVQPWKYVFIPPAWDLETGDIANYLPAAAAASLMLLLWALRRRIGRGPMAAALWYGGMLFPALGFVNFYFMRFSFVQDHFAYLPSIGAISFAAAGLWWLAGTPDARDEGSRTTVWNVRRATSVALLMGLPLVLLSACTIQRVRIFHDEETLWRDTLAKNRDAWIAHGNLSLILLEKAHWREAIEQSNRALALKPDLVEAHVNKGYALAQVGDLAGAIANTNRALELDPSQHVAHTNMGLFLSRRGRISEAREHYEEALRQAPEYEQARRNLENLIMIQRVLEKGASGGRVP